MMLTDIIERLLLEKVKQEKLVTYKELVKEINKISEKKIPEGRFMGIVLSKHLKKICEKYHKKGKGMLGSVVISKKRGFPSDGYFVTAQKLYNMQLKTDEEKKKFWQNEIKKVFRELKD